MTQPDDNAFDRNLAAVLGREPADMADVSRKALTALVTPNAPSGAERLGEVLSSPLPLTVGLAAGLLAVMALGYAVMPLALGQEMTWAFVLGGAF